MNKKIIYIDGWFLKYSLRGVGTYLMNILKSAPKSSVNYEYILLVPFKDLDTSFVSKNINIKFIKCKNIILWYEFLIPKLLSRKDKSTILFPSGICGILMNMKQKRVFSTIHDVSAFMPLKYSPLSFDIRSLLGRLYRILSFLKLVNNSEIIFTVSNTAKKGIQNIANNLGINLPKISVIYNASQINSRENFEKNKNLLCITGDNKQKNYKCILDSLNYFDYNSLNGWKIYLIGLNENSQETDPSGVIIIKRKYLNFSEINKLYMEAYGLIFPSLYESFGIPLVDALKANCHIIASDQGSPKEICKNSAIYFNPESPMQLSKKISQVINLYPDIPKINKNNIILNQTWRSNSNKLFKTIERNLF